MNPKLTPEQRAEIRERHETCIGLGTLIATTAQAESFLHTNIPELLASDEAREAEVAELASLVDAANVQNGCNLSEWAKARVKLQSKVAALTQALRDAEKALEPVADYPRYSTDPVASKALRDEMRKRGWSYDLNYIKPRDCFEAMFLRADKDVIGKSGEQNTEERAICIAALRAIAGEERKS